MRIRSQRGKLDPDAAISSKKLKGEGSPIAKEAFNIFRKSAELMEAATTEADKLEQIRAHSRAITKALRRLEKVLDRAE